VSGESSKHAAYPEIDVVCVDKRFLIATDETINRDAEIPKLVL
jgi:hypothetical protein